MSVIPVPRFYIIIFFFHLPLASNVGCFKELSLHRLGLLFYLPVICFFAFLFISFRTYEPDSAVLFSPLSLTWIPFTNAIHTQHRLGYYRLVRCFHGLFYLLLKTWVASSEPFNVRLHHVFPNSLSSSPHAEAMSNRQSADLWR